MTMMTQQKCSLCQTLIWLIKDRIEINQGHMQSQRLGMTIRCLFSNLILLDFAVQMRYPCNYVLKLSGFISTKFIGPEYDDHGGSFKVRTGVIANKKKSIFAYYHKKTRQDILL